MPHLAGVLAIASAVGGVGCGSGAVPIRGESRTELCSEVKQPPPFRCPSGTDRRGKPPPDGNEMWCQRWDGTRHGSYRRFPPGAAADAHEPDFVSDGTVIGAYREGEQDGAWWTRRQAEPQVNVAYYQHGKLVQRIHCRF